MHVREHPVRLSVCASAAVHFQALQAAVGEPVAGGVLVGHEAGRPVYWDSPQATPDGVWLAPVCG